MKKLLLPIFLLVSATAIAQFNGPTVIIDGTPASGGIKKIIAADLDNDNLNEIIVVQAFNVDNVAYYQNNGDETFGSKVVIDADIEDPVYIAAGDFNDDGWTDLTVITQTSSQLYVYLNDTEGDFNRLFLDDGFTFGNAMVVADFDGNGSDDIVAIGQHSIDLHRNNGLGTFTKEHILTTATSPNSLECMAIDTADMDNDGDMDVIVGETIGGVIYFNNGDGVFTPQVFTQQLITILMHTFDADGDGFMDAVLQHSQGDVNLYLNNGDGTMAFSSTLFNAPAIRSIHAIDSSEDGKADLHYAYGNKAFVRNGGNNNTFPDEIVVHEDNTLFITEVALADLGQNNSEDYIWSAVGGTLGFNGDVELSVAKNTLAQILVYPNPVQDHVTVALPDTVSATVSIYTTLGQRLTEQQFIGTHALDVSGLAEGIYIMEVRESNTKSIYSHKLIKQ